MLVTESVVSDIKEGQCGTATYDTQQLMKGTFPYFVKTRPEQHTS